MTPTTQAPNASGSEGTPYTNGANKRAQLSVRVLAGGEVTIDGGTLGQVRLSHAQGNRLIMAARMHSVEKFAEKVGGLLDAPPMVDAIAAGFARRQGSARWNLKEAFARLMTVSKEAPLPASDEAAERVIDEAVIDL